jgi:glucose/arabinose dehydrogenase
MKKAILFLILCAAIAGAQTTTDNTTTDKKPAPKAPAKTQAKTAPKAAPAAAAKPASPVVKPLVIPKEAVQQPDGSYKYTDKDGKRWVYNNMFFGVSRMEDMSDPNAAPVKQAPTFDKFTEDGETIRFERAGPFGPMKWERKKSELTDEERQAIANFKAAEKK